MKNIAMQINNPMLNPEQKRLLREEFRKFDHGRENDLSGVNREVMMDKFAESRSRAKKVEEEAKKITDIPQNLLEFSDDGLTLIYNLIKPMY